MIQLQNMEKSKTANKQKKPTKTNSNKVIQSDAKLTWLPKKTFELEFTIPWKKAKETYAKILKEVAGEMILKGFRKGKAPLNLVEKNTSKSKLYEEVIRSLLPETYQLAVQKHHLAPVVSPKIEPISVQENEDWQFKATACEKPEIKLGNYQQIVRGELLKDKIWTPDKGKPDKKEKPELSSEQKMRIATKALADNIKAEISDILLENEVNRMLSQLLDQVNNLGMTIQQYLASKNLTQQKLREDFRTQAEATLKLEFILQEIVKEQSIKIKPEEIEKMIQAIPDEKTRENLKKPQERAYIALLLAKRKAIDYLISL